MNDFDALLARVAGQARALGLPVSRRIDPHVAVNRRAVTRFGCCIQRGKGYTIELSERLLTAPEGGLPPDPGPRGAPHLPRLPQPRGAVEGVRPADERGLRLCHLPHRQL